MKDITVIIPICPMPSNPSTEVLDMTLEQIRFRLPDSEIILMFDGVNPNLMHLKEKYEQFTQAMLWKINQMENVIPLVFTEHKHQSLMTKEALELVRTPLILWSEQDTLLHNEIPFDALSEVIKNGYANLIRFHHEATIHPEHEYLMHDKEPTHILGQPFLRTRQWSGRPHLASTAFYKQIAQTWDSEPRFIEHIMYGRVVEGNFEDYRLHLYAPPKTYVRHKHIDGRRYGAEKYDPTAS